MRRHWKKALLALALLLVAGAAIGWRSIHVQANVGAGFVAKEVCGCMFVAGRSLASCRSDVPAVMDRVEAEPAKDAQGVYAFVPLFAWRTATWEPRTGCTLH